MTGGYNSDNKAALTGKLAAYLCSLLYVSCECIYVCMYACMYALYLIFTVNEALATLSCSHKTSSVCMYRMYVCMYVGVCGCRIIMRTSP